MNVNEAQNAVTLSGFVVAGVWAYRKLIEQTGTASATSTRHFVIGFGFSYIVLALIAQAAPELGGMLAVLIAVGDLLSNGKGLIGDLQSSLNATATATKGTS